MDQVSVCEDCGGLINDLTSHKKCLPVIKEERQKKLIEQEILNNNNKKGRWTLGSWYSHWTIKNMEEIKLERKKMTQEEINKKNVGLSGAGKGFIIFSKNVEQLIRQKRNISNFGPSRSNKEILKFGSGFPNEIRIDGKNICIFCGPVGKKHICPRTCNPPDQHKL